MSALDDLLHAEEDEPPQLKKLRERRRQVMRFIHGICNCFMNNALSLLTDCNLWATVCARTPRSVLAWHAAMIACLATNAVNFGAT